MFRSGIMRREVVVIVCIIGLALMMLFPYLAQRRAKSRRQFCEMRQMYISRALRQFDKHVGQLPGYRNVQALDVKGVRQPASWAFPILPYIHPLPSMASPKTSQPKEDDAPDDDQVGPYGEIHDQHGAGGPDQYRGVAPRAFVIELVCPTNPPRDRSEQSTWMSFIVNTGMPDVASKPPLPTDWPANGVFLDQLNDAGSPATIVSLMEIEKRDGTEFTLLMSENVDSGNWTDVDESKVGFVWVPNLVERQPDPGNKLWRINQRRGEGDGTMKFARPSSFHPGGVNVAYCSGRTEFISEDIDYLVFARLMTSDDQNIKLPGTNELVEPPYRSVTE